MHREEHSLSAAVRLELRVGLEEFVYCETRAGIGLLHHDAAGVLDDHVATDRNEGRVRVEFGEDAFGVRRNASARLGATWQLPNRMNTVRSTDRLTSYGSTSS